MNSSINKQYGYGIHIDNHANLQIIHSDNKNTPEAKCNTVSYPKVEVPHPNCNHNLAISNRYICYVVKGTLLRVIHTTNSSKLLLRGHESTVVDAKFAQCQHHDNVLCSVDDGSDSKGVLNASIDNKTHVYIWKLIEGTTLTADNTLELISELVCGYKIRASFVVPHPTNPAVWIIGYENCIAVLNTDINNINNETDMSATAYEQLSCFVAFDNGNVVDASFSMVGESISVSLHNKDTNSIDCSVYTYTNGQLHIQSPSTSQSHYCRSFDTVLYSENERICCVMDGTNGVSLKSTSNNSIVQQLQIHFMILNAGQGTADTPHRECNMNLIMHSDGHLLLISHK